MRPDGSPASNADGEDSEQLKREQRERYLELLQELRLILPGVQVLAGFLFTVPFASRFAAVDDLSRVVFGIAMVAAAGAVVVFMTPAVFHRMGDHHDRAARIRNGVRLMMIGLFCVAIAICSAMLVVLRLIYGTVPASLLTAALAAAMVVLWIVLPRIDLGALRRRRARRAQRREPER